MMNVAFIGCGWVTQYHLAALSKMNDVKIAAFCNPHVEKAQALAGKYGAKAYADCKVMLDSEKLDAVFVCVPPFAHCGQEQLIAERGIPMLVEKPLGLDLDYVDEVTEMVKAKKILAVAGYDYKYLPMVDRVMELIKGKKVIMARACWTNEMPPVYWWKKRDTCGGQIIEQSTHAFDLFRYMFGEVATVQGISNCGAKRERSDYDVEDSSSINLMFRNGIVGNICSSIYSPAKGAFFTVDVICDGVICTMSFFDGKLHYSDANGLHDEEFGSSELGIEIQDKIFMDALRTGDASKIRSTYEDGYKTLLLTDAAMASLEDGGCTVSI